jgi:hypothetical protein
MFSLDETEQIQRQGSSIQQVEKQLECIGKGFPFLKLYGSASAEKGIIVVSPEEQKAYIEAWDDYLNENHQVTKFVPASGAASRMFKDLFEFLEGKSDTPESVFIKRFFDHIHRFAFAQDLNTACLRNTGQDLDKLIKSGEYKAIIRNLLLPEGLNYGSLPKGLLQFHAYANGPRKAVVEHLVEGALYARNKNGKVHVHFTVSPEHRSLFEAEVKASTLSVEKEYGVRLHIEFSEQKVSTDTIAADTFNQPFHEKGKLVFRPGGHGALIENMNDLNSDVVFVKNIDNIVPDRLKDFTVKNKKLLAGILVSLQKQVFEYIRLIDSGQYTQAQLLEIIHFLHDRLFTRNPETKTMEDSELAIYLRSKLNRPIRVCGMVRNEGEPGGGPFWAYNTDGTVSLQILESSQIDLNDPEKKAMFEQGTHFNPVDLVCAIKNYQGKKFDLLKHVDPQTGFISLKSKNGKELRALELPGLWNGAMSDWNTLFVEVPALTFNPVKTVNDLLREEHQ